MPTLLLLGGGALLSRDLLTVPLWHCVKGLLAQRSAWSTYVDPYTGPRPSRERTCNLTVGRLGPVDTVTKVAKTKSPTHIGREMAVVGGHMRHQPQRGAWTSLFTFVGFGALAFASEALRLSLSAGG